MLGALLCNLPYPGRAGDGEEERAQRALENLRREYFEREKAKRTGLVPDPQKQGPQIDPVYKIEALAEIKDLDLPGVTATPDDSSAEDELALLFIIAEM